MSVNLELIGFILDTLGKLMVSYTTVRVHYRFWKEHQVDEAIFKEMRREQIIGMVGIVLILVGASLEMTGKF